MYLWILVPKTVALNIESTQKASCFWPTAEEFVFQLDASKCADTAMWTANEIASDDCIQLVSGPQGTGDLACQGCSAGTPTSTALA
jgi:hypothetical protein